MNDLKWIYGARTAYWEMPDFGRRYQACRNIKNRTDEFGGQYTLDAITERVNNKAPGLITAKILKEVEMNLFRNETVKMQIIDILIEDLGLTAEQFWSSEKLRPTSSKPVKAAPTTIVSQTAAPKIDVKAPVPEAAVKVESAKPAPVAAKPKHINIVNHISDSAFVLQFIGNEIHIMEDTVKNGRRPCTVWVAPADIKGGEEVVPRTSIYSPK